LPTAIAVLQRWPHLAQLATARRSTLTGLVALHTRGVSDVPDRVKAIRSSAAPVGVVLGPAFGRGRARLRRHEHLTDMAESNARIERATLQAQRYWTPLYRDDELLLSVPGIGPVTARLILGFLADSTPFASAKAAASYVGLNPSTWSSGTVSQPSRVITN
jgi:transposase